MRKSTFELGSKLKLSASLIAGCFLSGCASTHLLAEKEGLSLKTSARDAVTVSTKADYQFTTSSSADELYRLGRGALMSGYEGQAMTLFKAALKLDSRHSDARNGIAVILHSKNQNEEALAMIRLALEHDPNSEMLMRNQTRVKEAILAQGVVAMEPTAKAPAPMPIEKVAVLPQAQSFTGLSTASSAFSLVQVQANVYELRANPKLNVAIAVPLVSEEKAAREVVAAPTSVAPPVTHTETAAIIPLSSTQPLMAVGPSPYRPKKLPAALPSPKVLIANGKGERGLACREAKGLLMEGWKSSSCMDHSNFTQKRSVIYFVRGQEDAANKIRSSLLKSNDVVLKRVNVLSRNADIQILIGHDWSKVRATLRPTT